KQGWPSDSVYHFIRSIKTTTARQELYNSAAIINTVQRDPRVLGISPRIVSPVFFASGSMDIAAVMHGIQVEEEIRLFHFMDYITEGDATGLKNISNSIILGTELAKIIAAHIGDVVHVTTSRGEIFPLKVVGLFQSGIKDIDKAQSFTSVSTAQKLMGKPGQYLTEVHVKLKDINEAPGAAKEYATLFDIDAEDIQTANSQFETGTFIRTLISYTVGIVLLIVAGFGIYNILNMMIYEKMDTIAILKATGFSGGDVKRVFLTIAVSIGVFGGITGLVFGYLLSAGIDTIPFNTSALPTVKTYPVNYDVRFYVIGLVFSLVTTYLAGWFPARKASRVDPVVIIRGK
ncbi:MAG TPA: FtsX-like permease family protein, partial [Flavisolibacter sp.]